MPSRLAASALLLSLFLTGCGRDEVRTYSVPKEAAPALPGATAGAAPASPGALSWSAPDHWDELPASGMRRGSFTINGADGGTADLSIIAFPGDAGGLAANLNRWRGQIGLANLPDAEVEATIEHTDTASFHVDLVSMTGEAQGEPTRIEGAIFNFSGESWFLKLMGPADLVGAEAANFRAFVQTLAPAQR